MSVKKGLKNIGGRTPPPTSCKVQHHPQATHQLQPASQPELYSYGPAMLRGDPPPPTAPPSAATGTSPPHPSNPSPFVIVYMTHLEL